MLTVRLTHFHSTCPVRFMSFYPTPYLASTRNLLTTHLDGFSILLVNKTAAPDWTYVRDVGYDREWPLYFDGLPTKSITCGANA